MAGAEKAGSVAAPCLAAFSLDVIYGRPSYIHELSCGQVGAHLYSRMCCAVQHHRQTAAPRRTTCTQTVTTTVLNTTSPSPKTAVVSYQTVME
ncbi:hypothetical protein NFI96_017296 [Prochilodus magdalenae]|nr:hypothetical protein NFI96_017296 [Prochilodus magdalenae]